MIFNGPRGPYPWGKASHFFEGKAKLGLVPRKVHTWFVIIVDQDWNCLNFTNGMSPD